MSEQPDELPTRWEVELEFVQSLANIQYVNFLAQSDYFNDPAFINYLDYLNYWRDPKYAKHLVYPNCLHILTLLQNKDFCKEITNPELMNSLMNDMVKKWQGLEEVNTKPKEQADEKETEKNAEEGTEGAASKEADTGENSSAETRIQEKQQEHSDGQQTPEQQDDQLKATS